nr:venom protein U-MPTX.7-8 [Megalopyge opercularis]
MKYIVPVLVLAMASMGAGLLGKLNVLPFYDAIYDYILELQSKLATYTYYKKYIQCYEGSGECDAVGKFWKEKAQEAIMTACAQCTKVQKHFAKVFFEKGDKEDIEKLSKLYDPEGKYMDKFIEAVYKG